jgi:hypothetical protein
MILRTWCAALLSVAVVLPAFPVETVAPATPRALPSAAQLLPGDAPEVKHSDHGRLNLIRPYQVCLQNPKRRAEVPAKQSPDLSVAPTLPLPVRVVRYGEAISPAGSGKPAVRPVVFAQPRAPPQPAH